MTVIMILERPWHVIYGRLESTSFVYDGSQEAKGFGRNPINLVWLPITDDTFITTRHPKAARIRFELDKPLHVYIWQGFLVLIFVLCACLILTNWTYLVIFPLKIFNKDPQIIVVDILLGFTEPVDISWFPFAVSGHFLITMFAIVSFYAINLYNANFRAYLIGQTFEEVPETLDDVDTRVMPIVETFSVDYGQGNQYKYKALVMYQYKNWMECTTNITGKPDVMRHRYAKFQVDQASRNTYHCIMEAVIDGNATAVMAK